MSLLEIGIIALLATYRLTFMFNSERGPGDIFTRLRTRAGVRYDPHSNPISTGWLSEGILCYFCLSVWISMAITAWLIVTALLGHIEIGTAVLFPFALSGGSIYLKKQAG